MESPQNQDDFCEGFLEGVGSKGEEKSIPGISLCSFSIGIIILYVDVSLFPFNTVELNNVVYDSKCDSRL